MRNRHKEREHASNLGALLAHEIAEQAGVPAFIVDPVCVDEFDDLARVSGLPEIERRSLSHALNIKAVARRAAADLGRPISELNLVIAHLGGGHLCDRTSPGADGRRQSGAGWHRPFCPGAVRWSAGR